MSNKAVFLDRDGTILGDTGYMDDPGKVRVLGGVDLAIKSLLQGGYKIVVVTNQSGIARGILTEETLEKIHAEMCGQLEGKGARVDAIYYCPYHPDGTVRQYAVESDLRKPAPGMLLKGAEELDIDLSQSWMVGDSGEDIEAGRRAGVRTIRIRAATEETGPEGEDVKADFKVRNLVDAARIILRERSRAHVAHQPKSVRAEQPGTLSPEEAISSMDDSEVRKEILRHLRRFVLRGDEEEFSFIKLTGSIAQMLSLLGLVIGIVKMIGDQLQGAMVWMLIALVLQVMALTAFMGHRRR